MADYRLEYFIKYHKDTKFSIIVDGDDAYLAAESIEPIKIKIFFPKKLTYKAESQLITVTKNSLKMQHITEKQINMFEDKK